MDNLELDLIFQSVLIQEDPWVLNIDIIFFDLFFIIPSRIWCFLVWQAKICNDYPKNVQQEIYV